MTSESRNERSGNARRTDYNVIILAHHRASGEASAIEAAEAALATFRRRAEQERATVRGQFNALSRKLLETEQRLAEQELALVEVVRSARSASTSSDEDK
jgi:hypothetical protein